MEQHKPSSSTIFPGWTAMHMNGNNRKPPRRIFWLLYLMYLLLIVGCISLFAAARYRSYFTRISAGAPEEDTLPRIPYVDEQTILRLGDLRTDKVSSFINFPQQKQQGMVRIGCFGDSYTYGSEVNRFLDYPTQLQAIYRQQGNDSVEVLNFGSGWHGFHQAFILWNEVGRKFDLDYVLLGPECFQFNRDSSFNHTAGILNYYLHARYILTDEDVELIDVIGTTYKQRMAEYNRFIPHLRYLLYDREAPAFLKCFLARGTRMNNPFYYKRAGFEQEMKTLVTRLLRRMVEGGSRIILANHSRMIVDIASGLPNKNLTAFAIHRPYTFPYLAMSTHNSAMGNVHVAKQMFRYTTGAAAQPLTLLRTIHDGYEPYTEKFPAGTEVREFQRIQCEMNGTIVGGLVKLLPSTNELIRTADSASLLSLRQPGKSLLDSCFFQLPFPLREDMELTLRFFSESAHEDIMISNIELIASGLSIGSFTFPGLEFDPFHEVLTWRADPSTASPTIHGNDIQRIQVFLDKMLLCEGDRIGGKPIVLSPRCKPIIGFRPYGNASIRLDELPDKGTIFLILTKQDHMKTRVPFASWVHERVQ